MIRVLWVDGDRDHEQALEAAKSELKKDSINLTLLETVQDALHLLNEPGQEKFDLIVCGRQLPYSLPHQELKDAAVRRKIKFAFNVEEDPEEKKRDADATRVHFITGVYKPGLLKSTLLGLLSTDNISSAVPRGCSGTHNCPSCGHSVGKGSI